MVRSSLDFHGTSSAYNIWRRRGWIISAIAGRARRSSNGIALEVDASFLTARRITELLLVANGARKTTYRKHALDFTFILRAVISPLLAQEVEEKTESRFAAMRRIADLAPIPPKLNTSCC